ncbi:P-loop containing nucleoside triphosphate hydrolase protein, partial [Aureobasidium sp. EXF-3399]
MAYSTLSFPSLHMKACIFYLRIALDVQTIELPTSIENTATSILGNLVSIVKMLGSVQHCLNVLVSKRFSLETSQQLSSLEHILDLATIESEQRELADLLCGDGMGLGHGLMLGICRCFVTSVLRRLSAGSKVETRLVVRNMMPSWYSSTRKKMLTSLLRSTSCRLRSSRKMSASSNRRMAFQRVHIPSTESKRVSICLLSIPKSPALIMNKGAPRCSATLSAVRVLPTPGGPHSNRMMPRPLPSMTSSYAIRVACCVQVKPRMSSFVSAGSTRESKASLLKETSCTDPINRLSHIFSFKAKPRINDRRARELRVVLSVPLLPSAESVADAVVCAVMSADKAFDNRASVNKVLAQGGFIRMVLDRIRGERSDRTSALELVNINLGNCPTKPGAVKVNEAQHVEGTVLALLAGIHHGTWLEDCPKSFVGDRAGFVVNMSPIDWRSPVAPSKSKLQSLVGVVEVRETMDQTFKLATKLQSLQTHTVTLTCLAMKAHFCVSAFSAGGTRSSETLVPNRHADQLWVQRLLLWLDWLGPRVQTVHCRSLHHPLRAAVRHDVCGGVKWSSRTRGCIDGAAVRDGPRNCSVPHSIRVVELVVIVRGDSINLASMVDGSFQTSFNANTDCSVFSRHYDSCLQDSGIEQLQICISSAAKCSSSAKLIPCGGTDVCAAESTRAVSHVAAVLVEVLALQGRLRTDRNRRRSSKLPNSSVVEGEPSAWVWAGCALVVVTGDSPARSSRVSSSTPSSSHGSSGGSSSCTSGNGAAGTAALGFRNAPRWN